jgi:drug/metabolite transporter (DMT)-like permease
VAWAGAAVSFAGVGLVAAVGGGGSSFAGDALVLASLVLSAAFTVAQAGLLPGRDPVAVTALLAAAGLTLAGTLAPSTLFAYGQARVSAEVAAPSSTWSRWSARPPAPPPSATRSGWPRRPAARPSCPGSR